MIRICALCDSVVAPVLLLYAGSAIFVACCRPRPPNSTGSVIVIFCKSVRSDSRMLVILQNVDMIKRSNLLLACADCVGECVRSKYTNFAIAV